LYRNGARKENVLTIIEPRWYLYGTISPRKEGRKFHDRKEKVADYGGPRCGDCVDSRPPEPPEPTLGRIDREEVERRSALLVQLIILLPDIIHERRRSHQEHSFFAQRYG